MARRNKKRAVPDGDPEFQQKFWIVQRITWVVLTIVTLAAAFGLLSHGPLSRTTLTDPAARLSVTFERLERRAAGSDFLIRTWGERGEIRVRLGPAFLESYEIRTISPAPARASAGFAGYEAVFATASDGTLAVYLHARARRFGFADITVEAGDRGGLSFRQFIFP